MITYKVASVMRYTEPHRYFSLYREFFPVNTLQYKIGEATYPRYGYIFTFTKLEDAERYTYTVPTVIFEGEAEDTFQVEDDFLKLSLTLVNKTEYLKKFWNSVQLDNYFTRSITLCKKFTPHRILSAKEGMEYDYI
jgi:hypothetical protein